MARNQQVRLASGKEFVSKWGITQDLSKVKFVKIEDLNNGFVKSILKSQP